MEKLIKSLIKRDFKQLGVEDDFKIADIRNRLLAAITSDDEHQLISILQRRLIDLGYKMNDKNNDDIKLFIKHCNKPSIISDTEFELRESITRIENYDNWLFNNLYLDTNDDTYYEKVKAGYKIKRIHPICENLQGAISMKDVSGSRRLLYVHKLKSQRIAPPESRIRKDSPANTLLSVCNASA
jgi:hypothetical protein